MLRTIQRIGQAVFLRVEALFNLAFGERLNPLYYLGQISYYMVWVVVASGLYLYAFFETSVTGAYASVAHLTHEQWYFGGVMRSLHRYCSDAMVITMLLHLLRHFVFDRYRAFRWFSWVSGTILLWLVYVAGINGYMLPWDRLAQFVAIATAEWFDWLPIFNGTLVRNFIVPENVNDRLFSLLSFIHIGVPLVMLALLWVHTQRVPQARTAPPLPIMLTLTGALIVLSLVRPAVSQEPADLSQAVTVIDFDWFYLNTELGNIQGFVPAGCKPGCDVDVLIRPDDIVHDDDASEKAIIVDLAFRGSDFLYTLRMPSGIEVLSLVPSHHNHKLNETIGIRLEFDHLVVFPRLTG